MRKYLRRNRNKAMKNSTISKVSDLDQEIFEAMKSMQDGLKEKSGLKPRFIPITRAIHCFNESEYLEARATGAINSKCQLKYTLAELESCIIETVNRGDRFAGVKHFRYYDSKSSYFNSGYRN